jgi:phosphoglycolate phosphatase
LPACLPRKQGQVLPGVRPILDDLQGRGDVVSMLLTGNTQAGAKAKLEHYGIAGYFRSGAFCDGLVDRPSIARKALGLAGEAPAESVYVIGDTPHDIHCGKAIGARTVAVASGPYSAGELGEHGPWKIFESLPSPDVFLRELGIAP